MISAEWRWHVSTADPGKKLSWENAESYIYLHWLQKGLQRSNREVLQEWAASKSSSFYFCIQTYRNYHHRSALAMLLLTRKVLTRSKGTSRNHKLEISLTFQRWIDQSTALPALTGSKKSKQERAVGSPSVYRRWASTSPHSALWRALAVSELEGRTTSGCCDRCRWRRRAMLWPGE